MSYSEEYIHRFLKKELSDVEMETLSKEITQNPDLKELVEFEQAYLSALLISDAEHFRAQMLNIHEMEEALDIEEDGEALYPIISIPNSSNNNPNAATNPESAHLFVENPLLERMVRGNSMSAYSEKIKIEIVQELYPTLTTFLRFNLTQTHNIPLTFEIVNNENEITDTGSIPSQQQQYQIDLSNYTQGLYYWKLMLPDGVCADKFLIR